MYVFRVPLSLKIEFWEGGGLFDQHQGRCICMYYHHALVKLYRAQISNRFIKICVAEEGPGTGAKFDIYIATWMEPRIV